MDKQELREMIGEIKKAYARGDFDRVLMFADEMNIRKLSDSRTLEMIADAHAARGELEEAREVLLMAYEKTPMGRKMAYKLSELSIALDDLDNAVEFYEDFCKMAPHDNDRYLLKYKIGKAGGVSTEDLVKVLAVYCSKEVDEKWMYELATLYYKLRDKEKCLEICDNIILWFANGDYVQKAKSLKTRFGAEAEMTDATEKDGNGASQLGGDIPLEGFIDMSGQEEAAKEPERFYEQGLSLPRGDRPVVPVSDAGMEEITDAFLEEALQEKTPDQDMPIGEAMAIAEAKEQAEMVEAFERVTKTEVPLERPSAGRKYGRFEGTVTFETVPEKTQEGTPYEVNGEVITLPKTTFEDMSHDWTIPEELLNAEETTLPPEEFEEPVYGSHRYVPPTEQPKPTYEEPVFGAHRVVTKAEEEAAKAAELQAQLEAAKLKAEEEAARAAALQAQLEAAKEAIKLEAAKEEAAKEEAVKEAEVPAEEEITEASLTEAAPAATPVAEEVASAYEENIPAAFEQTEEGHSEQMEGELQVSDNPAIAAVIEPMAEPVAEVERAREGFDAAFPQSMDDPSEQPVYSEEAGAAYGERTEETTPVYRNEEDGSVPILFAISPREDEGAPDELVLPESVQAEVENARIAERKAPETKEPEKKPQFSSRLQTPVAPEPIPQSQAAPAAEPVATEVIRPTKSSKYSSVSSLFAEDEADNIDGQITLDSMFATYSKRDAVPEETVPEYPEEMPETMPEPEPAPATVAVEEEFPVNESTIAVDENEPPLITELGGDFSKRQGTAYEIPRFREPVFQEPTYQEPAYQEPAVIPAEPEPAGGDLSDFEKAMQAFDEARAEGKEGFDFKSLFAKATEEEFPDEESEDSEYEEYEEQLFDEESEDYEEDTEEFDEDTEEFDEESEEYDEEYEEEEYEEEYEEDFDEESDEEDNSDNADLEDDYEVGFGEEEETGEEWDEDSVEDYEEEYEEESDDGFDQEYDDYEDGEFDDEYVEEEEESFEETYEDEEFAEDYSEEPFEEEYTEEEYVEEDGYEEEPYEEEGYEEFDGSYEEGEYEEEAYGEDEYVEEYEEEPYEEEPYEEEYEEVQESEEAAEYSDEEEAYEEDEYEDDEYEDDYDDSYDDGYAEDYGDGTYVMPNSLKEELSEFLLIDGMEERINRTIGSLIEKKRAGDPTGGNLIVTGDTKSGKTYLTIAVIKAVGQEIGGNSRVAKVKADALNGKNMMKVFEKIAGSDLLIENVGYLNDETVDNLIDILSERNLSSMVALEGNQLAIDNMISKHPELNDLFQTRLNVSELNLTQWADLACQYAEEQGYTVSDMALLALHAKIDELNVPTERLGYENIRGIIDNAIANASKRGGGKFRFGSKKNKGTAKQLEEADFM